MKAARLGMTSRTATGHLVNISGSEQSRKEGKFFQFDYKLHSERNTADFSTTVEPLLKDTPGI